MKNKLMEVMREFYADGLPEGIREREVGYVEKLRSSTVVKGMRRTGKTFVTYYRMKELLDDGIPLGRIVHVNFDDDRISGIKVDDLHLINEIHAELYPDCAGKKCWYFLNEIQQVEGWESYAKRLVDSPKVLLCLTGSSSKLLSEEIATQMRGRSIPIEVFPLSFREFLRFNGIMKDPPQTGWTPREIGVLRKAIALYMDRGGFPDVQDLPVTARVAVLQEYVDAVLFRDVLERHNVASAQALRYTLDYLFHNYARKSSTRTISGVLKNLGVAANRESISNYLGYFRDSFLTYQVSVASDSLAVKRVNPDKHYLVDTGLIGAVCAKNDAEKGWLLENMVYMQLRRGFNKISYYVTSNGLEVDFLVTDRTDRSRHLVQVSWDVSDEVTRKREVGALLKAKSETGIDDCCIVTWDTRETVEDDVRIIPVWEWLL